MKAGFTRTRPQLQIFPEVPEAIFEYARGGYPLHVRDTQIAMLRVHRPSDFIENFVCRTFQKLSNLRLRCHGPDSLARDSGNRLSMPFVNLEKAIEILFPFQDDV